MTGFYWIYESTHITVTHIHSSKGRRADGAQHVETTELALEAKAASTSSVEQVIIARAACSGLASSLVVATSTYTCADRQEAETPTVHRGASRSRCS